MTTPLSEQEVLELRAIAETDQVVTATIECLKYRPTGMHLVRTLEYIERASAYALRREAEWIAAGRPPVSLSGEFGAIWAWGD